MENQEINKMIETKRLQDKIKQMKDKLDEITDPNELKLLLDGEFTNYKDDKEMIESKYYFTISEQTWNKANQLT